MMETRIQEITKTRIQEIIRTDEVQLMQWPSTQLYWLLWRVYHLFSTFRIGKCTIISSFKSVLWSRNLLEICHLLITPVIFSMFIIASLTTEVRKITFMVWLMYIFFIIRACAPLNHIWNFTCVCKVSNNNEFFGIFVFGIGKVCLLEMYFVFTANIVAAAVICHRD